MDKDSCVVSMESAALMTEGASFPDWDPRPVVLELSTIRKPRRPAAKLMVPLDLISFPGDFWSRSRNRDRYASTLLDS